MAKVLQTKSEEMQLAINQAPLLPGCYIYKDDLDKILYIGKAKLLRNRVKSYFNNYTRVEEKIRQMIDQAAHIEFHITDSEIEALILESALIKKYKPKYNTRMVDDKSYVYVKFDAVTDSKGVYTQIPSITVVRDKQQDPTAEYFGPYPDAYTVKRLIRRLRKIYPFCSSKTHVIVPEKATQLFISKSRPCFHSQIGLCNAACAGKVTKGEYVKNLNQIKRFFKGEKYKLKEEILKAMAVHAKKQEFESAARYRNMLNEMQYVGSNLHFDGEIEEDFLAKQKTDKRSQALQELVSQLEFPNSKLFLQPGFKIECYDISNFQGKFAVGSMVVFVNGQPEPSLYRRFKIKQANEPNDFAMLKEVLTRRFLQFIRAKQAKTPVITEFTDNEGFTVQIPDELLKRTKNWKEDASFSTLPNLMIIDGGKGQLSAVFTILQQFGLSGDLPLVGLAKKEEEIFKVTGQFETDYEFKELDAHRKLVTDNTFSRILLPRRSEALYLVQRIRDETHRFGITYHRKLRSKSFLPVN